MKKCIFVIGILICLIASTAYCASTCTEGEHDYYKFKCLKCGELLLPIENQIIDEKYAYGLTNEYDEWGEEIGKEIFLATKDATYSKLGEKENIRVDIYFSPNTYNITVGFYDKNGEPLSIIPSESIRYRTEQGKVFYVSTKYSYLTYTEANWIYANAFQFPIERFADFYANILQNSEIKFLIGDPAYINFTIKFDNIIISRMLEEAGAPFFWDAKGENLTYSNTKSYAEINDETPYLYYFPEEDFSLIMPETDIFYMKDFEYTKWAKIITSTSTYYSTSEGEYIKENRSLPL